MDLKKLINENIPSESRILASALTFSGGFVDAYTYIQRGKTLSAGQTGNVIFFAHSLARGNITGMVTRASTFFAFTIGLMMVGLFHKYVKNNYWRIFCLLPILLICIIVGFLPKSFPNYYIVPAIAFCMALQNASFSKIEGMAYNNVFTTGNLKKSMVAWSAYLFGEDKSQYSAAQNYMWLVISFAVGAMVSAFLQKSYGLHTIWYGAVLLTLINLGYFALIERKKKLKQ